MPPLPVLVFVVGTGSLGAEIAAVRLLAPYFGASTIVWANTIGVVLVALSVGYWLGGRLADRHPNMRGLCLVALSAAGLLALVPFAADPLLNVAVDALDEISAGAFVGSLLAVLVLVAVPVLLLGAVSPYAIRLAVSTVEEAGTVAGRLYAISTAGSLVGTLGSALVLIPLVGTRRTFLIFALADRGGGRLGAAARAALGARAGRDRRADRAAGGHAQGRRRQREVIYETETPYQYARVVEHPDGSRSLELNEGQAQHSLCRAECDAGPAGPRSPDSVLTGDYWDGSLVLGFTAFDRTPRRVAMLGNAAGTTSRAYEQFFPRTRVDGVEIDSELSDIGRRYFDENNPRLHLYHEDARPFIRRIDARYDVITVDAYRQPYIPFYLTTVEFFEEVRDRLAPDGVLDRQRRPPRGRGRVREGAQRDDRRGLPVRDARSGQADQHADLRQPLAPLRAAPARQPGAAADALRPTAAGTAGRIEPALRGGDVYTDDKAPVEWLIDKSIVDYAAGEDGH